MSWRLVKVLLVLGCVLIPGIATAQSAAIAGVARDSSGAVLPGVTVEVSSPALIEKTRSAVTDDSGQYRVVDLRPGTYSVTFTLQGFNTVKREGVVLDANFTAPVSADMRVGAIEETVTVTGESPIVDVQNTARRETVNRELLDTLPTGRDFQTI
ncbi:MAG TPA: carboxypeptidase-like regulatory domain-containing protein, partial [Vicinamibacterales bacterium]|nr:carboxypeptidase-like regulatory domain-containing protein [Vicinamibacterales bacterium]